MSNLKRGLSLRFPSLGVFAVVSAALAWMACDGAPPDETQPLQGPELVVGSSLSRHGLLVIPRSGGTAELRAIDDPAVSRWTGTLELPAASEAWAVGRTVILRRGDGTVVRYDPTAPSLSDIGSVPGDARWIPAAGGGAYVAPGSALLVLDEGVRRLESAGTFVWAAPAVGERAVALVETADGVQLAAWERGETRPAVTIPVSTPGPALVIAAGRTVVLGAPDGRLVAHDLPALTPSAALELDGPAVVLASTPSEHRLLAVLAGEERVVSVDPYRWRAGGRLRAEGTVRAVRPAPLGDAVLYFDGERVWLGRTSGEDAEPIATEWREDLPIALPGGRVLGLSGGELRLFRPDGTVVGPVPGAADAWWIPIRWTSDARPPVSAGADSADRPAETRVAAGQGVGLTTLGQVSGRAVARMAVEDQLDRQADFERPPLPADADLSADMPHGFYAVATSSRQLPALRTLRASLEGAGYPTRIVPRLDEANDIWYRLMVGPYESRDAAEAVAARLERERGIAPWIREIRDDVSADGRR